MTLKAVLNLALLLSQLFVFGCGVESIPNDTSIPFPSKAAALPYVENYKVFAMIDAAPEKYDLSISNGRASGIIDNVSVGDHLITIFFQYRITYTGLTKYIDIATASFSVNVTDEGALIEFTDDLYSYPDSDGDGYSNLQEIIDQTNPEVQDHNPVKLVFDDFANVKDACMGNSDSYNCQYYCGNYKSTYTDNPLQTKNITVYLSESYEDVHKCIRPTVNSKWVLANSTDEDIIEYEFVESYESTYIYTCSRHTDGVLEDLQVDFTLDDGLHCTGSINLVDWFYLYYEIVLDCVKDMNSCSVRYSNIPYYQ